MTYQYKAFGLAAALALGTGAQANTIDIQTFSFGAFNSYVKSTTVVEDFETRSDLTANLVDDGIEAGGGETFGLLEKGSSLNSKVGDFTRVGDGIGTGSTCDDLNPVGNQCENIALQFDPDVNGQGNIVPEDGEWSINAADTTGILWDAFLQDGKKFTSLFFALRDVADQGATVTVAAGDASETLENLGNDNEQLIRVVFGDAVSSALITMTNSQVDDSFTLDGAAITAVPLPAAGWLMLAGFGGLAALRRRKRTA